MLRAYNIYMIESTSKVVTNNIKVNYNLYVRLSMYTLSGFAISWDTIKMLYLH